MSKAPQMPLFVDAYLADTTHLTVEEHGVYLLLLMAMWRRDGSVPDDDKDIARIVGISTGKWRKIRTRLEGFLEVADGKITQKRLKKEWEFVRERSEKQSQNAQARWNKNNDLDDATASESHMPDECPQSHTQSHNKKDKKKGDQLDEDFAEFYEGYPRKEAPRRAKTAYLSARKRAGKDEIHGGMRRYRESVTKIERQFISTPAAWLDGDRWADESTVVSYRPRAGPVKTYREQLAEKQQQDAAE